MEKTNSLKHQQAQRMTEIFRTARQQYLDAGGDPRRSAGSLNGGNDNLTDEERREVIELGEKIFDDEYINNYLQQHQNRHRPFPYQSQSTKDSPSK